MPVLDITLLFSCASSATPRLFWQWGVKDEVLQSHGRLAYADALLDVFAAARIHSTYWIWRSYAKGGRDVREPEWGFELVHNPGSDGPERIEVAMATTLERGFAKTNTRPMPPCVDDWMDHRTDTSAA